MGNLKNTAITYAGYDYQTLHGVKLLLEWFSNPNLYSQVVFEADTSDKDIPPAIEDIVCKRHDGAFEYRQVKFTTDEAKHELSWDWLFKKTKKGRSLAKKLFDGLDKIALEKLHTAELVTNRVPSEEFSAALTHGYLDFSKITDEVKIKFIEELGSEKNIKLLFENLIIDHSRKDILKLKIELLSKAFNLKATDSIHHLMDEARVWAMYKNLPNNGGWIYLSDIKNILSIAKPKPLPQSFHIPTGYTPPCEIFHRDLFENVVAKKDNIIVVTGPPGRGKSTYLSYLTQKFDDANVPYIRHHYFLSIGDKTGDRFSHFTVQNDLRQQLETFHGADGKGLNEELQVCATRYANEDKPFVVLIDGLDHVWRDNNRDINPLDSLFNELFPPLDNVVYVIGTQPVEDNKLPKKLFLLKPRDEWLTLPPLTGNSILKFLKVQIEEERIHLLCHEAQGEEHLKESAKALVDLTLGHPLSVIYVTEYLSITKTGVSAYEIEKLPKIFGEHIYHYYSELWRVISYSQKYALHIICEFNFGWEKIQLNKLLNNGELEDYVAGIQHLLFRGRVGYKPFHESLIAFVKALPEHTEVIDKYTPKVIAWIDGHAPSYIQNIWKLKCELKAEMLEAVKAKLTREWVVRRLSEGYFPKELENILESASRSFIEKGQIIDSHCFRSISTRISNASHNVNELDQLVELTLKRAPSSVIDEYVASSEYLDSDQLAQLSICLLHRNNQVDSEKLNKLSKDNYNASHQLRTRQNDGNLDVLEIFRCEILLEHDISDNIKKFGSSFYSAVINTCVEGGDLDALIRYHNIFDTIQHKQLAELNSLRLCTSEGIKPNIILNEETFSKSSILHLARKLQKPMYDGDFEIYLPEENTIIESISNSYSEEFFHSLNTLADLAGDCSWLQCNLNLDPNYTHEKSAPLKIFEAILEAVSYVRYCVTQKLPISFTNVLNSIALCDFEYDGHWEQRSVKSFLGEFVIIALDCHILFNHSLVDANEIKYLVESDLYDKVRFIHWYAESKLNLLSSEAVGVLLNSIISNLSSFDIQERACLFIAAGQVLITHENELIADSYIKKAWDLTIGYGSYKDSTINDVINSIEYLSEIDSDVSLNILKTLSPFIANFDELTTEGSDPNEDINELLAKYSLSTLSSKYESELAVGEARSANNTLNSFLEYGDISSCLLENLCRTGLLHENLLALEARANKGDDRASELLCITLEYNGAVNVKEKKDRYSNTTIKEDKLTEQDFERFPPSKFSSFVDEFRKKHLYKEHYVAWFKYWCAQGKQRELLQSFIPISSNDNQSEVRYILDCLFDLSLEYKGKKKSFDILVTAHNQNSGWGRYYEKGAAFVRLDKIAEVYPERADEFIAKTTFLAEGEGLSLPYHSYTYLLTKLGRLAEANDFVSSLAEQIVHETAILEPEDTTWNWNKQQVDEVLLDILIARLMIPIAMNKWWVAQQLVELLLDTNFSDILETKLLEKLSKSQIELECIEVLTIFHFASLQDYTPAKGIAKLVKARSICSDLIIERMGLNTFEGSYSFRSDEFMSCTNSDLRHSFKSSNGRNFPPIYLDSLAELETQARFPFPIPLSEVMVTEWCAMQGMATNFDSYLSYYINDDGYSKDLTALVYPASGLRARSAYLRALEFAKQNYKLPAHIHEFESTIAFPFDSCLFYLKPENFCYSNDFPQSAEPLHLQEALASLTFNMNSSSAYKELGALSFSKQIDERTFIEVEIIRMAGELDIITESNEGEPWVWRSQNNSFNHEKQIEPMIKKEFKCTYLAAKTYPFKHYGHWHSEIESRGVFSPIPFDDEKVIKMSLANQSVEYRCDGKKIAEYKFANNNWRPSYHKDTKPNVITYLMLDTVNRGYCIPRIDKESFYCEIKVFTSDDSSSDYESTKLEFIIPVI